MYGSPPSETVFPMMSSVAVEARFPEALAEHDHVLAVRDVLLRR